MNAPSPAARPGARLPRAARALLAAPLGVKLVGANVLVAAAAVGVALGRPDATAAVGQRGVVLLIGALAAALACSLGLVALALRPLHALEHTAARVWRGDVDARVPPSLLADPAVARVGHALNAMLDGLARDRARLQALTADAIRAGHDERDERVELERALRDSAAQTLAAAVYQLSAARHAFIAPPAELALAHELASAALDEVRQLAGGSARRGAPPAPPDAAHA